MLLTSESTCVASLGTCRIASPLGLSTIHGDGVADFVSDRIRIRHQIEITAGQAEVDPMSFEKAGPREHLYWRPDATRAAIVTCGGICPGLNNVIRSAFLEMHHNYGVREVLGIRYGYAGLNPMLGQPPVALTPDMVSEIHEEGGTILGASRGAQDLRVMVDFLAERGIHILLCVGGDGTLRGARAIAEEALRRRLPLSAVGVPKTVDNDVMYVSRTFGVATAFDKTREILAGAHAEATSVYNGVGLVKVMGRDAGFIAAGATLASQEVNFTLIPEVPLTLDGERGFLAALRRRLEQRHHAVIVVAEGVGQELLGGFPTETDASGNRRLADIGPFLKDRILSYFKDAGVPADVKYFDPSYIIRSVPANSDDSLLCDQFARHAVHAAMAGKTNLMIGLSHDVFTHVPLPLATSAKKRVEPEGALWMSVLAATGQPREFR
jgi:6-phosphofructokinase 1